MSPLSRALLLRRDLIAAIVVLGALAALMLPEQPTSSEPIQGGVAEEAPGGPGLAANPLVHAEHAADKRARRLGEGLIDQHLQQTAQRWLEASPEQRDALLEPLQTVAPSRLMEALRAPRTYSAGAPVGRVAGTYRAGHRNHAFVAHIPEDYTPDRAWPVHIALHGGGGTPWRSCDYNWEEGEPARRGVILICPSMEDAGWWMPQGEASVLGALEYVGASWRIDPERVSIGGASSGGFGAWHAATRFPWLWSAAVVRCAATPRDPETLHNLGALPTYLIHGEQDHQIGVHHSRESFRILQEGGHDVRYTEVPEMGHAFARQLNGEVLDWLGGQRRGAAAAFEYRLVRRGAQPARVHWLKPRWREPVASRDATLSASLEPADLESGRPNRVIINTDAPLDGLTVLLPEGRWDRSQPVVVIFNGAEVYRGDPAPSHQAVLDSWADHRDPGLLTDVEIRLDLLPTLPTARAIRDSARSPG
jgi:poly(3-hydroxybutyrate) depolymerase